MENAIEDSHAVNSSRNMYAACMNTGTIVYDKFWSVSHSNLFAL